MSRKGKIEIASLLIVGILLFLVLWLFIHSFGVLLNNMPSWIFALVLTLWLSVELYKKSKKEKGMFK